MAGLQTELEPVQQMGLVDFIADKTGAFHRSLVGMMKLAEWGFQHHTIARVEGYLQPVAKHSLSADILSHLPCEQNGRAVRPLLSPEEWASILAEAKSHADRAYDVAQLVQMGVHAKLKKKGISLENVYGPVLAAMLSVVEAAPPVIRDSECFSLEERVSLQIGLRELSATVPADILQEAAQATMAEFCRRREAGGEQAVPSLGGEPVKVLQTLVQQIFDRKALAIEAEIFSNRERLTQVVIATVEKVVANGAGQIGGRPLREVLAERLGKIAEPEFHCLASGICSNHASDTAIRRWVTALERPTATSG
jgi:hypothetical protein